MNKPILSLTARQQEVLGFINTRIMETGVSPTIREIQRHFGLASPFGVQRHIGTLERKGAISRRCGLARWRSGGETY